jgi:hypothetical protein
MLLLIPDRRETLKGRKKVHKLPVMKLRKLQEEDEHEDNFTRKPPASGSFKTINPDVIIRARTYPLTVNSCTRQSIVGPRERCATPTPVGKETADI